MVLITSGPRGNAFYRLVAGILAFGLGLILIPGIIGTIGGLIFAVVDLILQLFRGDEGWSPSGSGLSGTAAAFWKWPIAIGNYIILGEPRSFPWTPWHL